MGLKLNLGCGKEPLEGWVNCDMDSDALHDQHVDVSSTSMFFYFRDTAEAILAKCILEHMPNWTAVLKGWCECLLPGGTIEIWVPDPYLLFKKLEDGSIDEAEYCRGVFGENTNEHDRHYHLISMGRLKRQLKCYGLSIEREDRINICSIVVARRP